jgi:multidrug efflux system outer membrane protein
MLLGAIFLALAFVLFLSGCMVGPNYQRPGVDTPEAWRFQEKEVKEVVNTQWWGQFNDPVLNELITISLQENKDVQIAAAVIEEFMGRYGVVRAPLFPQIGAGASVGRDHATAEGPSPLTRSVENPADNYQLFLECELGDRPVGKLRPRN